jgi:hypothetical protein
MDRHEDVFILVAHADAVVKILRVVPYEAMSGWSSKASEAEFKGNAGGD